MKRREFIKNSVAASSLSMFALQGMNSAAADVRGAKQEYYELRAYRLKNEGSHDLLDAYLAGTAVELSTGLGRARPRWTQAPERRLAAPWFAAKSDELRIVLLHESPAGFRERNIFTSENALSVA